MLICSPVDEYWSGFPLWIAQIKLLETVVCKFVISPFVGLAFIRCKRFKGKMRKILNKTVIRIYMGSLDDSVG